MTGCTLGFDTSNYTTSAAFFDGENGHNAGRLLDVSAGALGLRQSDALFQHVRHLPGVVERLGKACDLSGLRAVGASTRPRALEDSYMPCFLAGTSQAQALAGVLAVPFFPCSHQQGHLAAAAWSAGRLDLLDSPFLAWHLSGGTTELLHVTPDGHNVCARAIGGTTDISAGQLIDRTGVLLGLAFPAGKALDALYCQGEGGKPFSVKLDGLHFSLSGMENKVKQLIDSGAPAADVARFALDTVSDVVARATEQAQKLYPGLPVLCSGGVASNSRLREVISGRCGALFAAGEYSADNAMGVAILTHRALERGTAG